MSKKPKKPPVADANDTEESGYLYRRQCPGCGQSDVFDVTLSAVATMWADDDLSDFRNHDLAGESPVYCRSVVGPGCGWEGTYDALRAAYAKAHEGGAGT